jgi:hypothetical protein
MADNGKVTRAKLKDLVPDDQNANLHSERGVYMVNTSLSKLGAGRSILIDKNNEIIAGNLTTEQAADIGIEDVVIVDTDGKTLVAVRRTDMDLDDPESGARQMAYADNRTADVSIDFDPERLKIDISDGLDLSDWWQDFELEELMSGPFIPDPLPQEEPELASAHLIEIRCSRSALVMMQDTLIQWAEVDDIEIDIS